MNPSESPINVAILTADYPFGRKDLVGGVEAACYYLARALAALPSIHVTVFVARAERYGLLKVTRVDDNRVTVFGIPSPPNRWWLWNHVALDPARIVQHGSPTRFDLVHVQSETLWAVRSPSPKILTIHGIIEKDTLFRGPAVTRRIRSWANRLLQNSLRRQVPNVIIISPYVRQVFKPSPRQRLWDIDNPVADAFFDVVREPVAGRVLFAGTICPRKNVTGLIEGFSIAARGKPFCELRLAGAELDRAYATQCRELAAQLGVANRVKFLGSLPIEEMKKELAQSAFLALCSFQETAPIVISEAMASGVPVLASNVCGVPWMVTEGATGRLVTPTEPEDIARGMMLLLTSDGIREMGARARCVAAERFSASVVAKKTVQVYRSIIEEARSSVSSLKALQR